MTAELKQAQSELFGTLLEKYAFEYVDICVERFPGLYTDEEWGELVVMRNKLNEVNK